MAPVHFHEDAAARQWVAVRTMRRPLFMLKILSPLLMIGTLALVIRDPDPAAHSLDVIWLLALPFGLPFILAAIYPVVRFLPQEWTIDAAGIHGRGRVRGDCPWRDLASWSLTEPERLPTHARVTFQRTPAWRNPRSTMMVPATDRARVEAWLRHASDPA